MRTVPWGSAARADNQIEWLVTKSVKSEVTMVMVGTAINYKR